MEYFFYQTLLRVVCLVIEKQTLIFVIKTVILMIACKVSAVVDLNVFKTSGVVA